MIYYDITKMGAAQHRSGLMRLTSRLMEELGGNVTAVVWANSRRAFLTHAKKIAVNFKPADWLLTVEMFSEAERPGFSDFVITLLADWRRCFMMPFRLNFPTSRGRKVFSVIRNT